MGDVGRGGFLIGEEGFEGVLPLGVVSGCEYLADFVDESFCLGFETGVRGRRSGVFGAGFDAAEKGSRHETVRG